MNDLNRAYANSERKQTVRTSLEIWNKSISIETFRSFERSFNDWRMKWKCRRRLFSTNSFFSSSLFSSFILHLTSRFSIRRRFFRFSRVEAYSSSFNDRCLRVSDLSSAWSIFVSFFNFCKACSTPFFLMSLVNLSSQLIQLCILGFRSFTLHSTVCSATQNQLGTSGISLGWRRRTSWKAPLRGRNFRRNVHRHRR